MSGYGAYEDEMAILRGLSIDDEELAGFALELRSTLRRAPDPRLSATVVPRLAQAARSAGNGAAPAAAGETEQAAFGRRPRRRLPLAARIAIAALLLPLLGASLAVAGVRLPDPAVSAFEAVGIELPNQAETSDGGVSGGDDDASGEAATGGGAGGQGERSERADGKGQAGGQGKAKGNGAGQADPPPAAGQGNGNGPPAHSNAGGKGGGSANANGGNPNAGGGNPNAGGGNAKGGGGGANRPSEPPGQAGG